MKQILFVEMEKGMEVNDLPADGTYAVITYNGDYEANRRGFSPENVFPWRTTMYTFKDGIGDEVGHGSSTSDMLSRYDVAKVFVVGLDTIRRAELDAELSRHAIELITEKRFAALQMLLSLRPVSGTDADFDYEKGELRPK